MRKDPKEVKELIMQTYLQEEPSKAEGTACAKVLRREPLGMLQNSKSHMWVCPQFQM